MDNAADVVRDIGQSAEAIGALAGGEDRFREVVDAFRAVDADSFRRLLGEFEVLDRCELVCHWLSSKECVLLCLELCGPPPEGELPDPREFAQVVARITADEELVERLAGAVEDRDSARFSSLVTELEIERFCHLLCHWVCAVRHRLVCEVICSPLPVPRRLLVDELAQAGSVIGRLAENADTFSAAATAALAGDCDPLRAVIGRAGLTGGCQLVCEWFCSFRCIRVCLVLCRQFPLTELESPLTEAFQFAQASARLARDAAALRRLTDAVGAENTEAFGAAVKELQLERFCIQLCHWICFFYCQRFCECVCPNPEALPHWTQVEIFDIHPAAGLPGAKFSVEGYAGTLAEAFVFGELAGRGGVLLNGNCPLTDTGTGHPLEYRFVIGEWTWSPGPPDDPSSIPSVPPAGLSPVTQIEPTLVGHVYYADLLSPQSVFITAADADPQGWIRLDGKVVSVPTFGGPNINVTLSPANFLRSDALLMLNSDQITSAHPAKLPAGLPQAQAGRSLTTAEQEPIRRYRLQFEVRDGTTQVTVYTDTLGSIILNNSPTIVALDLEELLNNLCQPLAGVSTAHILYTVDHPHLQDFSVTISNNNGQVHPPPALSGSPSVAMPSGAFTAGTFFFRGGAGGPHVVAGTGGVAVDISGDPVCAYRVTVSSLTRRFGDSQASTEILYCK
jgi:hypothetical protein